MWDIFIRIRKTITFWTELSSFPRFFDFSVLYYMHIVNIYFCSVMIYRNYILWVVYHYSTTKFSDKLQRLHLNVVNRCRCITKLINTNWVKLPNKKTNCTKFSLVSQATTEKSANYLYACDYDVTLVSHSRWPPSRWDLRCRRCNLSENLVVE
jgi:hypothetical protein